MPVQRIRHFSEDKIMNSIDVYPSTTQLHSYHEARNMFMFKRVHGLFTVILGHLPMEFLTSKLQLIINVEFDVVNSVDGISEDKTLAAGSWIPILKVEISQKIRWLLYERIRPSPLLRALPLWLLVP